MKSSGYLKHAPYTYLIGHGKSKTVRLCETQGVLSSVIAASRVGCGECKKRIPQKVSAGALVSWGDEG